MAVALLPSVLAAPPDAGPARAAAVARGDGFHRTVKDRNDRPYPNIDVRGDRRLRPVVGQLSAAKALAGTVVRWGRYGTPRLLAPVGRTALTAASQADPGAIALRHLRGHAELYGLSGGELSALEVVKSYRTRHSGVRHVFVGQSDRGRPVYGSRLSVAVDKQGRILTISGSLVPDARADGATRLGRKTALKRAASAVGTDTLSGKTTATRITFPLPDGARPAWRTTLTAKNGHLYDTVVDAESGRILLRTDLTHEEGPHGRVFTGQNPGAGDARTVPFTGLGRSWVEGRVTTGNNAEVSHDPDGTEQLGHQPQTPASGEAGHQHFDYRFTGAFADSDGKDVTTDRNAVVTQAFYYTNRMHDYLYGLGFDEEAGNFQQNNGGNGGAGGDRAQVYVDFNANGADACNASFATPPDGQQPVMKLFVGREDCDGRFTHRAMNGDTVAHEYSHGLSHRLVGGGDMGDGDQTGALGEGWSDAIATSMWNDPVYGEYNNGSPTGSRSVRYDRSPLTYGDLCRVGGDEGCEVHDDGEIWATAMWDMRTTLIGAYGQAAGKQRHERLMVDGMKHTPSEPDFLDARDGILAADRADHGGADQCLLWGAFAARGMGLSAASPSQGEAEPATDVPENCRPTADAGGPYITKEGTDVRLDASGSTTPTGNGSYAWDFDGDGAFDDATGERPVFDRVGRDGKFEVGLRVRTPFGTSTDTTTVTVTNVAPSISLSVRGPREEGGKLTVSGTVTDPGWRDPLTATLDRGDGKPVELPGRLEHDRPDATLTFSEELVFGDNGTFTVKVCGSDDDTTTCRTAEITVANVDPTAAIDTSDAVDLAGGRTIVVHSGDDEAFTGRVTDPGSDDETMTWSWGDGTSDTRTSLVNPPDADPARSPSVQPRDVTDTRGHAYDKPCLYDVSFAARDDDNGSGADRVPVLVQGNAPLSLPATVWYAKYLTGDLTGLGTERLDCYLKIVEHSSAVFSEVRDVSTRHQAAGTLAPSLLDQQRTFDRQLLAAWLNFANGSFDPREEVDTNKDLRPDTPFLDVVQRAEKVRLDPDATREELAEQARILTCVNIPLV